MHLAPPEFHLARHASVREDLRAQSLEVLLVTSWADVAYLTGLFASAGVVVLSHDRLILIVDGRYGAAAQARADEIDGLEVIKLPASGSYDEAVAAVLRTFEPASAGFEASHMTVRQHRNLLARLEAANAKIEMAPVDGLVEKRRAVKDAWELRTLREAAIRLSDAAKCIIPNTLAGRRERDVAAAIDSELRRVGFDRPAFDTIVAAGPNSAMPHYRAGDRHLSDGDLVILDFGGVSNGYAVDMTRTITIGLAGPRQQRLLEQVAMAQTAAFEAVQVGRLATEVDGAARRVLEGEGLGEAFSHGTGHGLGLEVHERPRLTQPRPDLPPEPLQAGMVFTLEPGVYIDGWGGVRIEDDVVVTPGGAEWLTEVPRFWPT